MKGRGWYVRASTKASVGPIRDELTLTNERILTRCSRLGRRIGNRFGMRRRMAGSILSHSQLLVAPFALDNMDVLIWSIRCS